MDKVIKGIEELCDCEKELENVFDDLFHEKFIGNKITRNEERILNLYPKISQVIGYLKNVTTGGD